MAAKSITFLLNARIIKVLCSFVAFFRLDWREFPSLGIDGDRAALSRTQSELWLILYSQISIIKNYELRVVSSFGFTLHLL